MIEQATENIFLIDVESRRIVESNATFREALGYSEDELHSMTLYDVVAANRRFHRAVNLASRSPRLLTFLRQAARMVPTNYFELFPEQERTSREDHAALLGALERRDAPAARAIAEAHVLGAGEALGEWLRSRAG